jgi:transcription antitermination factor NusA-like protein
VRRLFELEVPEIFNGSVELKAVAREAGYRSKVAVAAKQEGLDPVGSCVGLRGVRIQNVVNELNNERIDVIQWDDDPKLFIANALSPAQVLSVDINQEGNTAIVVVPDNQLSLAIGKEGQNARLAARISGWRIDIKSASAAEADKVIREEAEPEVLAEEAAAVGKKAEKLLAAIPLELYEMPLEQLGLSARTFNLLLGSGITKLGEVVERSDKDLLGLRGFGQKSLAEVKERLGALERRPEPSEEELKLPGHEIEVGVEEVPDLTQEVEGIVEEEVELIPYKAPAETVEPEKPQLRFAEDIFGVKAAVVEIAGGKKGKKKKKTSREEKIEDSRARKGRKTRVLETDDGYEDFSEERES